MGGGLPGDGGNRRTCWFPRDYRIIDNVCVVSLHNDDKKMAAFFGSGEKDAQCPVEAGFLEHLRRLRNNEVDKLLLEELRKTDPMCSKLPRAARKHVAADVLPTSVSIHFPDMCVGDIAVPERDVDVLVRMECNAVVAVYLDQDSFDTLRAAALMMVESGEGPGKRRRRDKPSRVWSGFQHILTDYRREQFYALCSDADGIPRRYSVSVDLTCEVSCKDACDVLWAKLREEHHAELVGKYVLASKHDLDMFASEDCSIRLWAARGFCV